MSDPRDQRRWKELTAFIYERDGRECVICGTDENLSIDHITPLSLGGDPYDPDNLQVMCMPHNRQKSNKVTGQISDWINPKWLAWEKRH